MVDVIGLMSLCWCDMLLSEQPYTGFKPHNETCMSFLHKVRKKGRKYIFKSYRICMKSLTLLDDRVNRNNQNIRKHFICLTIDSKTNMIYMCYKSDTKILNKYSLGYFILNFLLFIWFHLTYRGLSLSINLEFCS